MTDIKSLKSQPMQPGQQARKVEYKIKDLTIGKIYGDTISNRPGIVMAITDTEATVRMYNPATGNYQEYPCLDGQLYLVEQ